MVDEVILKTFKDNHVDCNHIDELIRQISDPDSGLDKWKQNNVDLQQANWNNNTTDVNIMDQILTQQSQKDNQNSGMGMPSEFANQMGNTGMPVNGMPMNGMPMNGMPMNGMPMNGMPMNGMPMNGMPMNGMPMNGMPMNGMPMNGMPMNNLSDNIGTVNPGNDINANNMNMPNPNVIQPNTNLDQINSLNKMGGGVLSDES